MHVSRRDISILERGAAPHVVQRLPVVIVDVLLRDVGPDPAPVLDLDLARVLDRGDCADTMLMIQEP